MSSFIVLNFDCLSSPSLRPKEAASGNMGWGVGWYPNDDTGAMVLKDTRTKEIGGLTSSLSDWKQFRSTTFLCKVKGALRTYTQQDTQPFHRSFGGKDWLFLHNGELDREKLKTRFDFSDSSLEPVGGTDSELAFCYLLQQMQSKKAKRMADIPWETHLEWFRSLDDLGVADIVLSDSQHTMIFQGSGSKQVIRYCRQTPPHDKDNEIIEDTMSLTFQNPLDSYRTLLLFSSSSTHGEDWEKMSGGQLMVIRRGNLIWNSHATSETSLLVSPPATENAAGGNVVPQSFASSSMEQAEMGSAVTNIKSILRSPDGVPLEYRTFKIMHTTEYAYSNPVERSSHIVRLQPVEDEIQEIVHSTLFLSTGGDRLHYQDVFGNQAIHITVENPYSVLEIKTESQVKIFAAPPDDFSSDMRRSSIPLIWMPWQRQMMLPYLLPPELPEPQLRELTNFAMSFVERRDYHLMETLADMNQQIFKDFRYVQGKTTNETTPFEVYTSRQGVCQDFANLFICCARLLNIPARYRVGYIHTGTNYANKLQSEASHAWAEVYLPYIGWRGYDPTNGCQVGQEHIRVACGRNYRDATPTAGTIFKGGGGKETLSVKVTVQDVANL